MATSPVSGKRLHPVLVRRLQRVMISIEKGDPMDAILDDIFVVWRAFESSLPDTWPKGLAQRARRAVEEAVGHWTIARLPASKALIASTRYVERFSEADFKAWFDIDSSGIAEWCDSMTRLRQRAPKHLTWRPEDSRDFSDLLYRMRCTIIHSSLDTETAARFSILPAARDAMIEVTVAFAAVSCGLDLETAKRSVEGVRA